MRIMTKKVKRNYMRKEYVNDLKREQVGALSDKDLVVLARNISGKNQTEFGVEIGKSQSVVSKYEKGITPPPPDVISHCMTIVMVSTGARALSLDQIVIKLRQAESLPVAPCLYQAVNAVIDAFSMGARLPLTKNQGGY